jgi:hypothetical protein
MERVPGSVSQDDFARLKSELLTCEAEVRVRKAEVAEPELLLRQARRRLAALEAASEEKKDASPAPRLRQLNEMEKKIDELRKEIDVLRKELRPTGAGKGGDDNGLRGRIQANSTRRQDRILRWTMHFDSSNGNEYLRQLQGLGVVLGIPQDGEGVRYSIIRDLNSRPLIDVGEDVSKIQRVFWLDDGPESVAKLARALGMSTPPKHFLIIMPEELESRLLEQEQKFRGKKEPDIVATKFDVLKFGDTYVPVVVQQSYKD